MRRRTLLTLLFAVVAFSLALWDFAPRTSSQNKPAETQSPQKQETNRPEWRASGTNQTPPGESQDEKIASPSSVSSQIEDDDDKVASFELYRRNNRNPEILTYDELLHRARFMVAMDW